MRGFNIIRSYHDLFGDIMRYKPGDIVIAYDNPRSAGGGYWKINKHNNNFPKNGDVLKVQKVKYPDDSDEGFLYWHPTEDWNCWTHDVIPCDVTEDLQLKQVINEVVYNLRKEITCT
jgi:hypothetical protein